MSGLPPPPPGFEEDSDLALPPPPPPPPGYEIEELDNPMVPSSVNEDTFLPPPPPPPSNFEINAEEIVDFTLPPPPPPPGLDELETKAEKKVELHGKRKLDIGKATFVTRKSRKHAKKNDQKGKEKQFIYS